ncbi:MAG: hypothetical protein PVG38_07785 [Gammaproteobacteria bacterium]|jgi:hypothetical protein
MDRRIWMDGPSDRFISLKALLIAVGIGVASPAAVGSDGEAASASDDWFEADEIEPVPQVGAGELRFLTSAPPGKVPLSENRISISESSLDHGWVELEQCHRGLDAVPVAEIVYRYHNMRGLQVVRSENIGRAEPLDQSVQLHDVGHNATLCVQAEVQILYRRADGDLELRNGPFLRKFLDGYFPMHVLLEIRYPSARLDFVSIVPDPQPGFAVDLGEGRIDIDSRFVGTLNIAVRFQPLPAVPAPK